MKKLLFFILFVYLAIYSFGQNFSNGTKIVGGNISLGFNTEKTEVPGSGTSTDGSSNSISFNPFGGYFIIDGIIDLTITNNINKNKKQH